MKKDKEELNEGRIGRFLDKVFYKILNGIYDKVIQNMREDPELRKKIDDFQRSKEELIDTLEQAAENPEAFDDRNYSGRSKGPSSSQSQSKSQSGPKKDDDDDDTPEFLRKMMD